MRPKREVTEYIVWHCSATRPSRDIGVAEIRQMHLNRKPPFVDIGYHKVIRRNGVIEHGEYIENRGAHAVGYNHNSVAICMVGGLDEVTGLPECNFTEAQWVAAFSLNRSMRMRYPNAKVLGHRDLSPDVDGDGEVEPFEWLKACPCFNAAATFAEGRVIIHNKDVDENPVATAPIPKISTSNYRRRR